jgi:hypothetical protein
MPAKTITKPTKLTKHLLVEYSGDNPGEVVDKDFGEIVNPEALTESELREAVHNWLECQTYGFVIKGPDGKHFLVDLEDQFKIVDSDGNIAQH